MTDGYPTPMTLGEMEALVIKICAEHIYPDFEPSLTLRYLAGCLRIPKPRARRLLRDMEKKGLVACLRGAGYGKKDLFGLPKHQARYKQWVDDGNSDHYDVAPFYEAACLIVQAWSARLQREHAKRAS